MDAGPSPARRSRAQHRHELRTLTYVTLDQSNGGIVRNLSHDGIGVQVVAAVRPKQQLRVRFELRYPRLQVETRAEVVWATFSGQCGIHFLDMPNALKQQINQWIFGNLLEGITLHLDHSRSIFAPRQAPWKPAEKPRSEVVAATDAAADDGLLVSPTPIKVIALPSRPDSPPPQEESELSPTAATELDWFSQPLSGRALAWTVDALVIVASLLLFALVFLSVARETPRWPLASVSGAALMMGGMYWGFFRLFAGASLGAKLARIVADNPESAADEPRFR